MPQQLQLWLSPDSLESCLWKELEASLSPRDVDGLFHEGQSLKPDCHVVDFCSHDLAGEAIAPVVGLPASGVNDEHVYFSLQGSQALELSWRTRGPLRILGALTERFLVI